MNERMTEMTGEDRLPSFLLGDGDALALIRKLDWSTSPLGEPRSWPQSLRTSVNIMLDSGLPMFIAWGAELGFLYNDAYAAILGDKHPSAMGRRFHDIWSEIWDDILPFIDKALAGHATYFEDLPLRMRRRGYDEEAFFTFSYSPLRDDTGKVQGMFCAATETTRQVTADRKLRESESRFRNMADHSPMMMWVTDPTGYCSYLNRRWYEFTGQGEAEGEGFGWLEATHPEDRGEAGRAFVAANEARHAFRVEYRLRRADGTYRWAIDAASPRFSQDGEYLGYVGSVIDIDERREAEDALRESEDNYRHTVELNPQTTWTATPDGQLDRVAERWRDWTGGSGLGASWGDAMHPDDLQRSVEAWMKSVETGEVYDIEHRARMVSGEYRWMHSRAYPRRDDADRIVKWYGSTEDIHERKKGEEHLHLMLNELNHRVKNSLATVQAIAAQTFRSADTFDRSRQVFSDRLIALARAHDILTATNWSSANLREVIETAVGPHRSDGGGRFHLEGPAVLLPPKSALSLAMAFHELCTNAAKYGSLSNESGEVWINWSVSFGPDGGRRLSISWSERGGPTIEAPTRKGFGSRLIEYGLAAELGGEVRTSYEPSGVECRICAPLPNVVI